MSRSKRVADADHGGSRLRVGRRRAQPDSSSATAQARDALAAPDRADALAALRLDRHRCRAPPSGSRERAGWRPSRRGAARGGAPRPRPRRRRCRPTSPRRATRPHDVAEQLDRRRAAVACRRTPGTACRDRAGRPHRGARRRPRGATTSASECPARPRPVDARRRRARAARPPPNGWTSKPRPTRMLTALPLAPQQRARRRARSAGRVTLRLPGSPGDDDDACHRRPRRARRRRWRRRRPRARRAAPPAAERLRRLHRDQPVAVDGLDDPVAVDPLERVGDGQRRGPRRRRRRAPRRSRASNSAGAASGRAASCTTTIVGARRAPRPARRAPTPTRVAPPATAAATAARRPSRRRRAARARPRRTAAARRRRRGRRRARHRGRANCFGPPNRSPAPGGDDDRPDAARHRRALLRRPRPALRGGG